MKTRGVSVLALAIPLTWVLGCGGGSKPAEDASGETTEATPSADAPSEADSAPAKSEPAKSESTATKPSEPPADEGPKPTRTPKDILTAPDVVYMFSFNDSEPGKKADEKCEEKAGGDAKKKNECLAQARKAFKADGHRFKKDEKEQWWWLTVRLTGTRLVNLHKIPVEFGAETATSITLKPVGKDTGSAPMVPPKEVVIEVPNDYQIAIEDPKNGRLVFQAKVGIVTE